MIGSSVKDASDHLEIVIINPMDVTVEVGATNAAPQTMTVQMDKGGDEVAD